MNCPTNPRELAYKRNYRCIALACLILSVITTSAQAFGTAKSKATKFPSTPLTRTSLPLKPPATPSSKDNAFLNNNQRLSVSASQNVVFTQDELTASRYYSPNKVVTQATNFLSERAPGVALSVALAQLALAVANTSYGKQVSPLLWATIVGTAYGNVFHKPNAKAALGSGIKFAKGRLLRLGIILYGFKITLQQIAGIGFAGLATDVFMVASTLTLGIVLGTKWLKLDEATSTLIGSGAAICGCSAVLATQPVVGGESHEVSAAVGTVVLGGTLSMFLYPFLFKTIPFLAASPKLMGIYTGSTIHEIAGVVASGNAMGPEVATTAVVTKLARVLLLAPALTTLSWLKNRKCIAEAKAAGITAERKCKLTLPWFALAFVGISALNSAVSFPNALVKAASKISAFSLMCAMAALGIDSDFQAIRRLGARPMILAAILWTWLVVGGLGASRFFLGL